MNTDREATHAREHQNETTNSARFMVGMLDLSAYHAIIPTAATRAWFHHHHD